jgi:hypothetical protein
MFIAATTPEVPPSSVGAAWVGVVALRQGFGEAGGAPGHKHVAPTGLDGLGGTRRSNPKVEGRRPKEARTTLGIGFRISAFFRVSAFGLRISGRQNMIFPQRAGL